MSAPTAANAPPLTGIRSAGATDVGKVRAHNEDSMIVDPIRGLYVVLDGMGGANAGEVASQTARDAIREYVLEHRGEHAPAGLLEAAIQHGCERVWTSAQSARERHGMGTTCVACLVVDPRRAIVGHVGDSRAYLLRAGRLAALTRDHTIVGELLERGVIAPEEVERHPYKNVLSRNLGATREAKVDVTEVALEPGDRLLLCSDGLYGFASAEAIQYLLGSGDAPEQVARDLIDLALRGGGGDNVTAIVIEMAEPPPTSSQVVRGSGAIAWWQKRQRFVQETEERGLLRNPICRALPREEALELVARSLCQAVFHDLEKSTGVNVWTFAQNLAGGWFERGGAWQPLRELYDVLDTAAHEVVDEVRASDAELGVLLELAVSNALVVAELAIAGLLAERLAEADRQVIAAQAAIDAFADVNDTQVTAAPASGTTASELTVSDSFAELATVPFVRDDSAAAQGDEVAVAIGHVLTIARGRIAPNAELLTQILGALDPGADAAAATATAREIWGVRPVDDTGVMELFEGIEQARLVVTVAVHQIVATDAVKASALGALGAALQQLAGATAALVLEAARPYSERLRDAQRTTAELRGGVARAEEQRAQLESKLAQSVDQSQPWHKRGTTEW